MQRHAKSKTKLEELLPARKWHKHLNGFNSSGLLVALYSNNIGKN